MAQGFVKNTAVGQIVSASSSSAQGRLTLTSNTPITTSDVTGATTIYYTPYQGNMIGLYTGGVWTVVSFTEVSIAVPSTTNTMYDVWGYNSSGTLVLDTTAWTNDTTRATALTTQDGIYVKSGDATRRYLGSFRTTSVSGQTEDSISKRWLYNYYNRTTKPLYVIDTTNSWTYSAAAPGWRQARASSANQLDFIQGVVEDQVFAEVIIYGPTSSVTPKQLQPGIGINSTTSDSSIIKFSKSTLGTPEIGLSEWIGFCSTGRNYIAWLEQADNSGGGSTQTYYGDDGGTKVQSGIWGSVIL